MPEILWSAGFWALYHGCLEKCHLPPKTQITALLLAQNSFGKFWIRCAYILCLCRKVKCLSGALPNGHQIVAKTICLKLPFVLIKLIKSMFILFYVKYKASTFCKNVMNTFQIGENQMPTNYRHFCSTKTKGVLTCNT